MLGDPLPAIIFSVFIYHLKFLLKKDGGDVESQKSKNTRSRSENTRSESEITRNENTRCENSLEMRSLWAVHGSKSVYISCVVK